MRRCVIVVKDEDPRNSCADDFGFSSWGWVQGVLRRSSLPERRTEGKERTDMDSAPTVAKEDLVGRPSLLVL